jgi:hypothetical protein
MSKLPAEFVTAAKPKQKIARRTRKASLISPDPVVDPRELILQLTDEEYQALEQARQKLHQAGSEVTLDQMIHRVFAEWMMRAAKPAAAAQPQVAPRDERMVARLRAFVAAPLRSWRDLAGEMWRVALSPRCGAPTTRGRGQP